MAALLHDQKQEVATIAGLKPHWAITCGTPHAGVRGTLNPMYTTVVSLIGGQSGREMLLQDDPEAPILARMSRDEPNGLQFVTALAAFERRVLYANTLGDCICPYATAGLVHYNYSGQIEGHTEPSWVGHHVDSAGVRSTDLAVLQLPGVSMSEVYEENGLQRDIVDALRERLSWERYDLAVPAAMHNIILGAHSTAAVAACCDHVVTEMQSPAALA